MAAIMNFFHELFSNIPTIKFTDALDILIVAFLIYQCINLIHSTSAARIAKGIILLLLLTALTETFHLYAMNFILSKILELGMIALVIMFQPELRRALERVGGKSWHELLALRKQEPKQIDAMVSATVAACEIMSKERVGALMAFERKIPLDEYFKSGTVINAEVSEQLIRNIFFPKAALHDGAVIMRDSRLAAAGCVLPLSENPHLSSDLGTRHRAGVGMSEATDAVVVIVSEETGTISVAIGGMLKRHLAPKTLERLLLKELAPIQGPTPQGFLEKGKHLLEKAKDVLVRKDDSHEK